MYVAIYDRNLNHITNITDVKYDITRRVFDFDNSSFEGVAPVNVENGFIFVLCDDTGKYEYAGFMKSISQDKNHVRFNGEDFKKIFDTEVVLDYATTLGLSPKQLSDVFTDVSTAIVNEVGSYLPILITYPQADNTPIDWIANYDMQHLVINAISFLKPYLAYYGYYIKAGFDLGLQKIKYEITKNVSTKSIKLSDFIHETKKTSPAINKAVATMKFDNVMSEGLMWISSSREYWSAQDPENRSESIQSFPEPLDDASIYSYGYAFKVRYQELGAQDLVDYYYQVSNKAIPRPSDLPKKSYFLGNDNQIYENTIPTDKIILPIQSKIFEDGFFQKSQFNAVNELVNSRYNENIILTNKRVPIDLNDIEPYTLINVYDKVGNVLTLPVSETQLTNNETKIKLGFKKTLFTEIIKEATAPGAIKPTNAIGSSVNEGQVHSIINDDVPDIINDQIDEKKTAGYFTPTLADLGIVELTQAEFDALVTKDPTKRYWIYED